MQGNEDNKGEKTMRLWPLCIIDQLPRQQLLGQHRECCALRGKGWGRKHSTVDYVFRHKYFWLFAYHKRILDELTRRGYKFTIDWGVSDYRGKQIGDEHSSFTSWDHRDIEYLKSEANIYPEHDDNYLDECIANLARKGVTIDRKRAIERLNAA